MPQGEPGGAKVLSAPLQFGPGSADDEADEFQLHGA